MRANARKVIAKLVEAYREQLEEDDLFLENEVGSFLGVDPNEFSPVNLDQASDEIVLDEEALTQDQLDHAKSSFGS